MARVLDIKSIGHNIQFRHTLDMSKPAATSLSQLIFTGYGNLTVARIFVNLQIMFSSAQSSPAHKSQGTVLLEFVCNLWLCSVQFTQVVGIMYYAVASIFLLQIAGIVLIFSFCS